MTNTRTIIAADNFLPSSRKTRILPPSIFWLKFALPQRLISREQEICRRLSELKGKGKGKAGCQQIVNRLFFL